MGAGFAKYTIKGHNAGEDNPFYGKTHTEETKQRIRNRDKSYFCDPAYLAKLSKSSSGVQNPMYGTSYYQIWLRKYGKEKADELQLAKNKKTSEQCRGEGNPMYGRPAPQGSGNGWSGWYNDWFFRSLRELSYVVKVLEVNGDTWESAESIKIPYCSWDGKIRNYLPDFLVNSSMLVEVKPSKLKSSVTVRAKQKAAEEYANQRGWSYVIVDPPTLSKEDIKDLRDVGKIRFTAKYERLYQQKYNETSANY